LSTELVLASLPGGAKVWVEATTVEREAEDSERNVARPSSDALPLNELTKVISGLAELVHSGIAASAPQRTTAEFWLDVGLDGGALTSLWVRGPGPASIKITLQWG
jgi:hypothetical protein